MILSAHPWIWPLATFLIGSFPTGYLLGRGRGIDIRQHGSGNIGATNVGRVLGRNWGLLAFACDFFKGCVPLVLIHHFVLHGSHSWRASLLLVVCGFAAIIGHNYTPWLSFKGGKGIATTAGVLGAILPWTLLVVFSLWAITVAITRLVSLGSILAAVMLPVATAFFYPREWIYLGLASLAGFLGIWRHRSNIKRLLQGTEPRLGKPVEKSS
jgi:acyl phosphate:glycerol-3-phosphate acyltransferase